MILSNINQALANGELKDPGLFPKLTQLKKLPYQFNMDFGLKTLPTQNGILLIRGARQYGKSTWLEEQLLNTIETFGAGSAFYLNGDLIANVKELVDAIENLLPAFHLDAQVKRIFIDEITAVTGWEIALKQLADQNKLSDVLIITTGSKATDLRRGAEKLPGRKGKLERSSYLFTALSYREFHRVCGKVLKEKTLLTYLLSGGSPIACSELVEHGYLPEYVIELTRDWIDGEIVATGRNRTALRNILRTLHRFGGTALGQAKLARESGLTNNTVAANYMEILNDLGCISNAYPWDQHRKQLILRKPCKYHFTNLLATIAYYAEPIRAVSHFLALPSMTQGMWLEWLVAQECQRRSAIAANEILEPMAFWANDSHEIDFVINDNEYIEVKKGKCSALAFSWFAKQFPKEKLIVINQKAFQTERLQGITLEEFFLQY